MSTVTRRVSSRVPWDSLTFCSAAASASCRGALRYSACGTAQGAVSGCRVPCPVRGGHWRTAPRHAASAPTAAAAGRRRGQPGPNAGAGNARWTERVARGQPGPEDRYSGQPARATDSRRPAWRKPHGIRAGAPPSPRALPSFQAGFPRQRESSLVRRRAGLPLLMREVGSPGNVRARPARVWRGLPSGAGQGQARADGVRRPGPAISRRRRWRDPTRRAG